MNICVQLFIVQHRFSCEHNFQLRFYNLLRLSSLYFLFLAVLALCCCMGFSVVAVSRGYSLIAMCRLLIVLAFLVASIGSRSRGLQELQHVGSVVAALGLQITSSIVEAQGPSCSMACGIFLDPRLNPWFLNCQLDSLSLSHQGSPCLSLKTVLYICGRGCGWDDMGECL